MNPSSPVARVGSIRRIGLAGLRLITTLAMLVGTGIVGMQSAGAQSSGDRFDYAKNGLEWSVSWDGDVWSETSSDAADFALESAGSLVLFSTLVDLGEDPASCLAGVVPSFEDGAGAIDSAPFEDDNGDPVADETNDYAYEIRTDTFDFDGSTLEADVIHACYALDRSSLLWVVGVIPTDSGELEDAFALFDGVEVAGEPVELGLADVVSGQGGGSGNETPEASQSSRSSRSARPSASDEETPEASPSRRSSRSPQASPSDEETPEASPSRRSSRSAEASPSADGGGADDAAGTYTSPSFGYALDWNPDNWTVNNEASNVGGRDRLDLQSVDSPYIVYIEGSDEWSNPDDCVATLSGEVSDFDPDNADPVMDANGDPFEISGDDRSLAAYVDTTTSSDSIALFECRADPDSDLIVAFTFLSGDTRNFVEDVYPDFENVADSLTFEGSGSDVATPVASDEEDATPEASRRGNDDETPQASDDSTGGTGVDGNTYVSPTYGYELSWDENVWTVEDESSNRGVDALTLTSDILTLNVTGSDTGDGDPQTCLNDYTEVLNDRGDGDAEIVSGDNGDLVFPSDDGRSLEAYLFYSVDGEQFASDLYCIALSDSETLTVEFTTDPQTLASDDATTQINDILNGLRF